MMILLSGEKQEKSFLKMFWMICLDFELDCVSTDEPTFW